MQVVFRNGIFICRCEFAEREFPKKAGFRWEPVKKQWYTSKHGIANKLREYCDDKAKYELQKKLLSFSPWLGSLPCFPHLTPLAFQKEAALFALSRNRSYLALDPGLGKTIIAALVASAKATIKPVTVFYVCPSFLQNNVENEFRKWASEDVKLITVPDSMIHKEAFASLLMHQKQVEEETGRDTILFVDEAHRFKNPESERTRALFGYRDRKLTWKIGEKNYEAATGIANHFNFIVYFSGTPMPNRPIELFPILSHSAPETIDFKNLFEYACRYCDAKQNGFGWDFSGSSNLKELSAKIKDTFLLRMRKDLLDLPPKLEELLIVDYDQGDTLGKISRAILEKNHVDDLMKGVISLEAGKDELHLATYRRLLGNKKIDFAYRHIATLLAETDESLLVFGIHKEVIATLEERLRPFNPIVVTGDVPSKDRQKLVDEFQNNPARRLFMGNIDACGVGYTLTKATRVIFVEFKWVPGENDQASDRAHRIGQKDSVFAQYMVFRNSVDKAVMDTILGKRQNIKQI